jgi:hypothetical protein
MGVRVPVDLAQLLLCYSELNEGLGKRERERGRERTGWEEVRPRLRWEERESERERV